MAPSMHLAQLGKTSFTQAAIGCSDPVTLPSLSFFIGDTDTPARLQPEDTGAFAELVGGWPGGGASVAAFAELRRKYFRYDVSLLPDRRGQTQLGSCSQPFPQRLPRLLVLACWGSHPNSALLGTKGLYPRGSPFLLGVCVYGA